MPSCESLCVFRMRRRRLRHPTTPHGSDRPHGQTTGLFLLRSEALIHARQSALFPARVKTDLEEYAYSYQGGLSPPSMTHGQRTPLTPWASTGYMGVTPWRTRQAAVARQTAGTWVLLTPRMGGGFALGIQQGFPVRNDTRWRRVRRGRGGVTRTPHPPPAAALARRIKTAPCGLPTPAPNP
jgi:hypothetical protein